MTTLQRFPSDAALNVSLKSLDVIEPNWSNFLLACNNVVIQNNPYLERN